MRISVIIVAQLFGILGMGFLFLMYQQKSRKALLISKLSADICWVIHYLFLGAVSGIIPNAVGIFRELVFVNRNTKKWASSIMWPILFIIANWCLGFKNFNIWYNLLPISASTCATISLWLDNPRLTKMLSVPISVSFLIYDVLVGSYIGIINEIISLSSFMVYFIRIKRYTSVK